METNDLFQLLEGVCPACNEEVTIKSIGGVGDEPKGWTLPEGHIGPTIWKDMSGTYNDAILGIEFECPNGHVHYVEKNRHGDWNS